MAGLGFGGKVTEQHQQQWAKHLGVPVEQTNSMGMEMVLIPPGEFDMGSRTEEIDWLLKEAKEEGSLHEYVERIAAQGPQHRVRISRPFYLGKHEVTQEQYQRVMGTNPSHFSGAYGLPVEQVSWDDAVEFCRRLSERAEESAAGSRRLRRK